MTATPPKTTVQTVLSTLGRAVLGRIGWIIGSVLLVFSAGFLLLWWTLLEQRGAIADAQARASERVEARLVQRYFNITPTDLETVPSHSSCEDVCRISLESVAVFEFALPDGRTQQAQFSFPAHDWQHNTEFELGIPLLAAEFRIDPSFHAQLQAEASKFSSGQSVWERFWEPVEDAGHWLLRLRDPPPAFMAPLRYDPKDPSVALLDLPLFRKAQTSEHEYLTSTVLGMLFFVGVICVAVLYPAVSLMMAGYSRRVSIVVTVAICLSVPVWAPYAGRIAPWLSDQASAFASELKREFDNTVQPGYLAKPVADTRSLRKLQWQLVTSPQAPFLAGLDLALPISFDPLDHAGALDAFQASFDRQLQAMDEGAVLQVLNQLNHYQADTVWELFVPALLRITSDETMSDRVRSEANKVLFAFARDWDLPDVDVFLYHHRLDNYARLRDSTDSDMRELANSRLAEAEALVKRQLATM